LFYSDCIVVFDLNEICVSPETWQTLKVTCINLSPGVTDFIDNSSTMTFAFHLLTGAIVTCERSPCQCTSVNVTAAQLSCHHLPTDYDRANLTCYLQDRQFISVHALVHVRGNACLGILSELAESINTTKSDFVSL